VVADWAMWEGPCMLEMYRVERKNQKFAEMITPHERCREGRKMNFSGVFLQIVFFFVSFF
jgi:hypothetical protein